jgi:Domain of unknown function (DUF4352)
MKRWHVLVISIGALPLIAADSCSGGTGGTAAGSSPTTKIFAVGSAMVGSDGKSVTVTAFKRNYKSGNQFEVPAKGKECVQVTFALVNGSTSEWSLPTAELNVVDANGQKYTSSFTCGTSDDVSSLVAKGHATAKEIYEVPKGMAIDATWQPDIFSTNVLQTPLK